MSERSRLDLLKQAGLMAWEGLKTAVKGVDVVIDPNEPPQVPATETEQEGAGKESPRLPSPDQIGTVIGRRAMAAAEHRVGSAQMVQAGAGVDQATWLSELPLTLALYPGPAAPLLAEALGLEATYLPSDGALEVEATAHDLAWLPLEMGRPFYRRLDGGRLLAEGGYRRAALVRFPAATPRYPGLWALLGDDALAAALAPDQQGKLLLESPQKLWGVLERGEAEAALLGGDLLERALHLPGAVVEAEAFAPLPIWGLFGAGRVPAIAPVESEHLQILPVPQEGEGEA